MGVGWGGVGVGWASAWGLRVGAGLGLGLGWAESGGCDVGGWGGNTSTHRLYIASACNKCATGEVSVNGWTSSIMVSTGKFVIGWAWVCVRRVAVGRDRVGMGWGGVEGWDSDCKWERQIRPQPRGVRQGGGSPLGQ